ncbi:heat-shock protein [Hallella multisaccharivorax DSM 17128]|uniref:Heat shock protein Hsp20 n=2 Tax=Hallella multisaccharivorax TaxID=310514 RepID=F8N9F3_9BACT|nr:heat shock protein Hsp20 [Hallella multisaccharivorax DSM 17128]GJG31668.1 heat-shock protein [Hallella multisaccharivorax DSM 17128]
MTMLFPVLNDWFDNDFSDNFYTNMRRVNTTAPAVNVKEDADKYTMEVAVPGIKKDFVRIDLNKEGDLELAIENKLEHHEESGKTEQKEHYLRREFSYSNYQQEYTLPEDVDKDHISAKVEDGILSIVLPKVKKEEANKNARRIEIG